MVERNPIVVISGELQELPSGDTLPGSGGGGGAAFTHETPDYTNDGGQGERRASIGASWTSTATSSPDKMLNGSTASNTTNSWYFSNGTPVAGEAISFFFSDYKYINEMTWKQSNSATHGTWKIQGSNDAVLFTDLSSDFTLGGTTVQIITLDLATSGKGFRIYRFLGISGATSNSPYLQELEFKIGNALPDNDVPSGGTTGQVLAKKSATNYDAEWIDPASSAMVQTEITSTAYSTVSADFAGNVIRRMNNAAAQTITVEPSMANGEPVTFIATGAGAVSFAAGTGVTIHSANSNLTIAPRYGSATLVPDATTAETYYLIGDLA